MCTHFFPTFILLQALTHKLFVIDLHVCVCAINLIFLSVIWLCLIPCSQLLWWLFFYSSINDISPFKDHGQVSVCLCAWCLPLACPSRWVIIHVLFIILREYRFKYMLCKCVPCLILTFCNLSSIMIFRKLHLLRDCKAFALPAAVQLACLLTFTPPPPHIHTYTHTLLVKKTKTIDIHRMPCCYEVEFVRP